MNMAARIICEREAGEGGESGIATLTLFNPDKLNAINAAMWRQLKQTMDELHADETLRCVVIRGEGTAFAAGGDLEEFVTLRSTYEQAQVYHGVWVAAALESIVACRHPTVAMIQGPCIGCGLATIRGSAMSRPETSVQFSYKSAMIARAAMAPEISEPPREKVLTLP